MPKNRIGRGAILNRSCAVAVGGESKLLTGALKNLFQQPASAYRRQVAFSGLAVRVGRSRNLGLARAAAPAGNHSPRLGKPPSLGNAAAIEVKLARYFTAVRQLLTCADEKIGENRNDCTAFVPNK